MPSFLTGDELGSIKRIHCSKKQDSEEWSLESQSLRAPPSVNYGGNDAKLHSIQRMALSKGTDGPLLAAARKNGTVMAFRLNGDTNDDVQSVDVRCQRFKPGHRFVGLDISYSGIYVCTSNGALSYSEITEAGTSELKLGSESHVALPMRLCDWKLSPSSKSFAYGGDEVDLSLWDIERAMQSSRNDVSPTSGTTITPEPKKRRKAPDFFPGEIWRAKNLPNDSLNLRQPVHITSLTYLGSSEVTNVPVSSAHLVTGTASGAIRRYDTRAARRPVANWTNVSRDGGIRSVEAGSHEHELFASDNGSQLCALDLRNGRVLYSYKKIQGAVTSLASAGDFLGSASLDRYVRLYSTASPPATAGKAMDERGDLLASTYMITTPTVIVADTSGVKVDNDRVPEEVISDDEDVWDHMENADDSEEEGRSKRVRR